MGKGSLQLWPCDVGPQYQMRKRQQLQEYLDAQLQRAEANNTANTFDQLEQKLNQIERKLVSLKAHQIPEAKSVPRLSEAAKDIIQIRRKKEVACQSQTKALQHEAVQQEMVWVKPEAQITPQKQLNIISKIMSEGHFQMNPSGSHKAGEGRKQQKRGGSQAKTAKTQQLGTNKKQSSPSLHSTAKKLPQNNKSSQKKLGHRQSSQKYLNKTVQDVHLVQHLQKDIELCMKSNAQLRVKVSQLEDYKNQYCKLREIMSKFERQRKRHRV